uniref:von Willebrand factor A domain containing 3B n=1 Tax=Callithrix jacchus TaxID=9483 RepID=A0A8I3W249_CALJA
MEKSGSSSTISKQQLQRKEGWSNTKTDLAEQRLISSETWLQLHGLKSNKLTLKQILSQIGFPHCEDYVASLGRLVASRYADGLFPQLYRAEDGRVYNLTAKSELIYQFVEHLTQAVESYKQRMDWLTSKSRQIFGVILEQCITIVLDFGGILEGELDLCREALTMVLQEQVAHITNFNIIRVSQEPVKWQENATPVTKQSIAAAIRWVEKLTIELTVSKVGRMDALLEAGKDKTTESIYYFVVGDVPEESKELLLQSALETPYPVHTVSFNAREEGTIAFLKDLSAKTHSRFHAFAERTECVEFPAFSTKDGDSVMTWNSRKLKGKLPPGAGVREDVFLVWREMEEACSTLAQIQRLVAEHPKPDVATVDCESETTSVEIASNPEDTWDSKMWLRKYGLKAQKLSLYDVLADCSFRHADGVVDIKAKPENESVQTSAIGSSTNTLSALKTAFADKETQAIYLLTDGRPDQPPEMVIDQVKVFQEIPIYTISFNYNDEIANRFLKEIAALTGGEFHFYNFGCKDSTPPEAVQNEDLTLLDEEMEQGYRDLEKIQELYSESLIMDWWYNAGKDWDSKHQKEICSMVSTPEKCAKPQSDVSSTQTSSLNMLKGQWGLSDQKVQKKKVLHAGISEQNGLTLLLVSLQGKKIEST